MRAGFTNRLCSLRLSLGPQDQRALQQTVVRIESIAGTIYDQLDK